MPAKKFISARELILVALAATVILSLVSYSSIITLNKLAGLVDHTNVVQLNVERTYSALSDADSELKSFLITKDSSYYLNLTVDEERIRQLMATLQTLTQDNPLQNKRINSLDSLIQARWVYMASSLKGDAAHYEFFSAKIGECNKLLERSIRTINNEEEKLLKGRIEAASKFQSAAPLTLLSVQLIIVLCLLIGFFRVTADLKTKERLQLETLQKNEELKEQKDFIQGIFENTVDVIIIFDIHLNMIAMNKKARELYDTKGNSMGKNVLEIFPQASESKLLQAIRDAIAGKASHSTMQESVVYPGTFYESFFVPLYATEKIIGAMAIHHDVSELVKMTSDVRSMNHQLQKSNQELEQFAYVTSHDLQEPLRKISTFADLAKRDIDKKDVANKHLDKLRASAERMSLLIRDVLNYARLESSESNQEEVNLNDVLDQVLQDFELKIAEREAIIESNRLPVVVGSKQQLTQVFSNIIGNALKFCTATPCIKISCSSAQDRYEIAFADNGIGFEQAHADRIFGVFQRLHHHTEFSGTGIGLALCKRIVENHGGTIRASSTPNKGTTITITLPITLNNKRTVLTSISSLVS